jgi:hypothetical protein
MPFSAACLPVRFSPIIAWYIASRKPISSAATLEAPPPGRIAQLISLRPNCASSEQNARSQANSGP